MLCRHTIIITHSLSLRTGLPPPISIGPNEHIVTEMHLLRITPALNKRYKAVGMCVCTPLLVYVLVEHVSVYVCAPTCLHTRVV